MSACRHPIDEFLAKRINGADAFESGHGAAEPIGFGRSEFRCHDWNTHDMFLEQRHAERFVQYLLEFIGFAMFGRWRWKHDFLESLPASQIGMHHVALNRTRANDRNFDDEIVEFGRPQPRQHRHLSATFDLEYPDGVGALDHAVDRWVFVLDVEEIAFNAIVRPQKIEAAPQTRQHAKSEESDFE